MKNNDKNQIKNFIKGNAFGTVALFGLYRQWFNDCDSDIHIGTFMICVRCMRGFDSPEAAIREDFVLLQVLSIIFQYITIFVIYEKFFLQAVAHKTAPDQEQKRTTP